MCSTRLFLKTRDPFMKENSDANEKNFSELQCVYWSIAPTFLRQVFRDIWRLHTNSLWDDNKSSGKKLMQTLRSSQIIKNPNVFQTDLIKNGNSNQWDLLLLLDIIKNLLPLMQTKNIPNFSNTFLRDVEFLKHTRNRLAHAGENTIDERTFKALWDKSVRILTSMGMNLELMERQVTSDCDQNITTSVKEAELRANQFRLVGDEFMDKCMFTEAAAEYSKGIHCENVPPRLLGFLFSNRSLANLENKNWQHAKDDAKSSITLLPHSFLGYARLGRAYEELESFQKAILYLTMASRLGDKSKSTNDSLHWCKMMGAKRSCQMHLNPDYVNRQCLAGIQDLKTKFRHGTKEDFIMKGIKYFWGTKCCPVDYKTSAEYFSLAADMNSAYGLFQLGKMTMEGKGVKKDLKKGFELYVKAASQNPVEDLGNGVKQFNEGVSNACHAVGISYNIGFGVECDKKKALDWYHKALLCGHAGAANNIGLMMENTLLRIDYLKLSAHFGLTNAIENLSVNYRRRGCIKEAQQYFHYALHRGSIVFKGREDEFVADPSLENDFDPKIVADQLEKEVRRSSVVGHYLEKVEEFKKIFEKNETVIATSNINDQQHEFLERHTAIITHRQALRANHEYLKEKCGWRMAAHDSSHSFFGAEKIKFAELENICFEEMENQNEKKNYLGRFMEVAVIEDAIIGSTSTRLLVEDRNGDLGWLLVYNYAQSEHGRKKTHEEIGYGCRLSVFYPVLQRNISGLMEIRVDNPELIFKRKNLRNEGRCRYCGKTEEKAVICKCCRRVKYCSVTCLRNDAEHLQHAHVCLKVIN